MLSLAVKGARVSDARQSLRSFARAQLAILYSLATAFAAQIVLLASGVLVARMLGVENRGHLALFALVPTIIAQIGSLGLPLATTYHLAQNPWSGWPLVRRGGAILWKLALVGIAVHLILLLVAFRAQSDSVKVAAFVTLIAVPGMLGQAFGLAILQGRQRFRLFNLLRMAQLGPYAVAVVVLFVVGSHNLLLISLAWSLTVLVGGAATLAVALWRLRGAGPAPEAGVLVRFGIKSLPGQMSPIETLRLDQILVGVLVGPAALGLYVVGLAFANLPRFIAQSIGMVAYPKIAAGDGRDTARQVLGFIAMTALICGLVIGALELFAPVIVPLFFGSDFSDAVAITRVVLLAGFIFSLRRILVDCLRGLGHPECGVWSELAGLVVFVPAVGLLVPRWDALGMAWALSVAGAANLLILIWLMFRTHRAQPSEVLFEAA